MARIAVLLLSAAALAGCGDKASVDERNASVGEVAEAVAKANPDMKFKPGRWESTLEFVSVEAPGMPPEVARAMQGAAGRQRGAATCLTPEQAARPNADFFNKEAGDCTYEHFTMGDGKLDAKMVCGKGGEGSATVEMKGDYGPEHYSMAMATRAEGGAQGAMTMRMKVDSRHAGACRGDEDQAG